MDPNTEPGLKVAPEGSDSLHSVPAGLMVNDRQGAQSSAAIYGYDLDGSPILTPPPPAIDVNHLPMLVWLRGDESICSDFILGTDEVMTQLGIKRSRLTQISGRELRVGRMRMGRYLRPVYRQADVDAYKQWTRATATHVKAASVLQDAAKDLSATSETLASEVQATQVLQRDTLESVAGLQDSISVELSRQLAALASADQAANRDRHYQILALFSEQRRENAAAIRAIETKLESLAPTLLLMPELQKRTLHEIASLQSQNGQLVQQVEDLQQKLAALTELNKNCVRAKNRHQLKRDRNRSNALKQLKPPQMPKKGLDSPKNSAPFPKRILRSLLRP